MLSDSINAALDDDEVDATVFMWGIPNQDACTRLYHILTEAVESHPGKTLVCCLLGEYAEKTRNMLYEKGKVMAFGTPHRAIRALAHLARYSAFRRGL